MNRFNPSIKDGLSNKEVESRLKDNLVNYDTTPLTKSIKKIIIDNTFTLFNLLNIILGIAVFITGSIKNATFLFIILWNTLISTYQEIRSKKITDKLSLISEAKVTVIRDGKEIKINKDELVLDDLVVLKAGNQIVADAIIVDGDCEVNESCITGESDNIYKNKGDMLLSGSYVVTNTVIAKVEHVGKDNYTSIITSDAKYVKKVNSELMNSLNFVIKIVSFIVIPMGLLLFFRQYNLTNDINKAILNTVGALIGMIPDGLILLTSTVLATSTVRLAKNKVLVQQLYCIETLARVDTLCIDKTGTITEGYMEIDDIIPIDNSMDYIENILNILSSSLPNDNATMDAIVRKYKGSNELKVDTIVPFSSAYKYSAVTTDKSISYVIGAPSIIGSDIDSKQIEELSLKSRVLILSLVDGIVHKNDKIKGKTIAIILLKDKVRTSASKTLKYLKNQDVNVKILSGDSKATVSSIASKVGFDDIKAIDVFDMDDKTLINNAEKYNIFARVSPNQKKVIVKTLKSNNHTVAMIGDGVNDVLALKESDCSIAMNSGSDAARNVSELVLLDSDFDAIPKILDEGRRSINNIERSSSLFLTKTLYATMLAIIFTIINANYPFEPIQLSLYNLVAIGIPSIILALEPNHERIKKGSFLLRVLRKALPTSIAVAFSMVLSRFIGNYLLFTNSEISTISIYILVIIGLRLIYTISNPFNNIRRAMYASVIVIFVAVVSVFRDFLDISSLNLSMTLIIIFISVIGILLYRIVQKVISMVDLTKGKK